jgi:hypothetical protein
MKLEILEGDSLAELNLLSQSLGNTQLVYGNSLASVLRDEENIIGFAAVQLALHASGSWIHPDYRGKRHTYELRSLLESEMRIRSIPVYYAFPGNDFERMLFKKYGHVREQLAQVKEL